MSEAMDIDQVWELQLEEVRFDGEPNPDTDQTANDYILNVGQTQDELTPYASAATPAEAEKKALELRKTWKCVEIVYMPVDDDDINEIIWAEYEK
jgi:hypothetical protein